MHSLESANYMKIDRQNYLLFDCSKVGQRVVTIQQEYLKKHRGDAGTEATFIPLYKVQLHDLTLRELLLFFSIYVCQTLTEIVDIVVD